MADTHTAENSTLKPTFLESFMKLLGEPKYIDWVPKCTLLPVKEGERIIGILPERLYLLFGLFLSVKASRQKMETDHFADSHEHSSEKCKVYHSKLREQYLAEKFLLNLLHLSIREDLSFWERGGTGIREGLQVVTFDEPEPTDTTVLLVTDDIELRKSLDRSHLGMKP